MKKLNIKISTPVAIGAIIILALIIGFICFFSCKSLNYYGNMIDQKPFEKGYKGDIKPEEPKPSPDQGKIEKNIDLSKSPESEILACKVAEDCGIRLDTCNCKTVCRNIKDYKYIDSCNKACKIEEMDFETQDCQCQNDRCVKKVVQYFQPNTDAKSN